MFTDRRANSLLTKRQRQPWPKDKTFKILSLDGGGIKGIYTAEILRRCEEELGNGEPVARYFDLIAGTSTGGIIALALGMGIPAREITAFYRDDGRKIFPPLPRSCLAKIYAFFKWVRRPKLPYKELETALKNRFQEHLLGESVARLLVPAFMMPKAEIAVFKTDHHKDFQRDWRTPMWEIARATSAAPTYLKGHEHKGDGRIFIDGGVWANNPVMLALIEALTTYNVLPEQIEIFSIGTGNIPLELRRSLVFGGLWAWRKIINAAIFLTADNAIAQATLLLGPDQCLRIAPSGNDAHIEMDDYDAAFARLPVLANADFNVNRHDISTFFTSIVELRERHYT